MHLFPFYAYFARVCIFYWFIREIEINSLAAILDTFWKWLKYSVIQIRYSKIFVYRIWIWRNHTSHTFHNDRPVYEPHPPPRNNREKASNLEVYRMVFYFHHSLPPVSILIPVSELHHVNSHFMGFPWHISWEFRNGNPKFPFPTPNSNSSWTTAVSPKLSL